jgi:hypothetical protein
VNAIDRADVNTGRVLSADAGFANYVNSHYVFLLPKSTYRISRELNENDGSKGTVIVPVHFLFATAKTPGREFGAGYVAWEMWKDVVGCALYSKFANLRAEQSGNNIEQDRARNLDGIRLTFRFYE